MLLKVPLNDAWMAYTLANWATERVSANHFDGNLRCDVTGTPSPTRNYSMVRFVIRANSSRGPGARRTCLGHRSVAATWEAHRLVMREIFDKCPDAILVTAMATYRGKADFEQNHGVTYDHNAGSMMHPVAFGEL